MYSSPNTIHSLQVALLVGNHAITVINFALAMLVLFLNYMLLLFFVFVLFFVFKELLRGWSQYKETKISNSCKFH